MPEPRMPGIGSVAVAPAALRCDCRSTRPWAHVTTGGERTLQRPESHRAHQPKCPARATDESPADDSPAGPAIACREDERELSLRRSRRSWPAVGRSEPGSHEEAPHGSARMTRSAALPAASWVDERSRAVGIRVSGLCERGADRRCATDSRARRRRRSMIPCRPPRATSSWPLESPALLATPSSETCRRPPTDARHSDSFRRSRPGTRRTSDDPERPSARCAIAAPLVDHYPSRMTRCLHAASRRNRAGALEQVSWTRAS